MTISWACWQSNRSGNEAVKAGVGPKPQTTARTTSNPGEVNNSTAQGPAPTAGDVGGGCPDCVEARRLSGRARNLRLRLRLSLRLSLSLLRLRLSLSLLRLR